MTRDSPLMVADGPDDHGVAVASITWSDLAEWSEHPAGDEFARHLQWKEAGGAR